MSPFLQQRIGVCHKFNDGNPFILVLGRSTSSSEKRHHTFRKLLPGDYTRCTASIVHVVSFLSTSVCSSLFHYWLMLMDRSVSGDQGCTTRGDGCCVWRRCCRFFPWVDMVLRLYSEERLDYESERASLMSTRSGRMSVHSSRSGKSADPIRWSYRNHRSRYQPIGESDE